MSIKVEMRKRTAWKDFFILFLVEFWENESGGKWSIEGVKYGYWTDVHQIIGFLDDFLILLPRCQTRCYHGVNNWPRNIEKLKIYKKNSSKNF